MPQRPSGRHAEVCLSVPDILSHGPTYLHQTRGLISRAMFGDIASLLTQESNPPTAGVAILIDISSLIGEVYEYDAMTMMTEMRAVHRLIRSGAKEIVELSTGAWPR